jgi:hypothetical protein
MKLIVQPAKPVRAGREDTGKSDAANVAPSTRGLIMSHSFRQIGFVVAFAASTLTLSNGAQAYTAEAQQMCTNDAFRLCSSEIPNIPRITACMVQHKSELSPGCRAIMDRDSAPQQQVKTGPDLE